MCQPFFDHRGNRRPSELPSSRSHHLPLRSRSLFFFCQAEDGIRDVAVTGVQTCALPISVVTRIRAFGAVVMGKASLHEFAYGATSNNPHYGPVRNPRDPERVAGGSSGGSAVEIGRAACRGRGEISVVAVSFKKKKIEC